MQNGLVVAADCYLLTFGGVQYYPQPSAAVDNVAKLSRHAGLEVVSPTNVTPQSATTDLVIIMHIYHK